MKNIYYSILVNKEKDFEGQIVDIINAARLKMSELDDMYRPDRVNKYKHEVIDEALKMIEEVRDNYFSSVLNELEQEKQRLQEDRTKVRTNTELLLNAVTLNNKLQINKLRFKTMESEELFNLAHTTESNIDILGAKAELSSRASDIKDDFRKSQYLLRVSQIKEIDVDVQIKEVESYIQTLKRDATFLPGVSIADKLTINNPKEYLLQDVDEGEEVVK